MIHANTPSYVGSHVTGFSNMVKGMVDYMAESPDPAASTNGDAKKKKAINVIPGWVEPSDMREVKRIVSRMGIDSIVFPDTSDVLDAPQTRAATSSTRRVESRSTSCGRRARVGRRSLWVPPPRKRPPSCWRPSLRRAFPYVGTAHWPAGHGSIHQHDAQSGASRCAESRSRAANEDAWLTGWSIHISTFMASESRCGATLINSSRCVNFWSTWACGRSMSSPGRRENSSNGEWPRCAP